jgi:hypothetical protein
VNITTKCDGFTLGLVFDFNNEPASSVLRQLGDHDLPAIRARWGELMVELIPKCWNADPKKHHFLDAFFGLFKSRQFGIVLSGNPNENARLVPVSS